MDELLVKLIGAFNTEVQSGETGCLESKKRGEKHFAF